jgi:hypothetical protein
MFEQLAGALLFLFGFQSGNVRGESTPSAHTASSSSVLRNDITSLGTRFLEKQKKALSNWEAKRASFSASLSVIKDEKKRTRLETVQNRLNEINTRETALFMKKLTYLNWAVVEMEKIASTSSQESGKDMSGVTSKLSSAAGAIADAISIVTVQAEKTYVMTITSEANMKNDFKVQRSKLASDLKKCRDAVQNARKKVGEALKALKDTTGKPIKILIPTEETT